MSTATFDYAILITRVVIVSAGFIGNLVSFIIFSRQTFRKNSISTYCQALAVFDCFNLMQLVVDVGLLFYNVMLPFQSNAICKLYFYMSVGFSTIPGWILVAFSIDKMLSMRRSQIDLLKKKWFQWLLVAAIAIVNFLMYLEVPIRLQLEPIPYYPVLMYCELTTLSNYAAIIIMFLVESCVVPFVVMFALSLFVIYTIYKSRKAVERTSKVDQHRKTRDTRFAISSLTFNVLYVAFKIPLTVVYILEIYNITVSDYFMQLAMLMFFFNSSASFFIHFASNSLFRRELSVILQVKFNRVDSSNSTKDSTKQRAKTLTTNPKP